MEAMLTPEPSRPKGQRLMARRCEDLKTEIIEAQRLAVDEEGRILVWAGAAVVLPASTSAPAPEHAPLVYTPQHITVLFADITGSMVQRLCSARDSAPPRLHPRCPFRTYTASPWGPWWVRSFPRRRESRGERQGCWMPAFAS